MHSSLCERVRSGESNRLITDCQLLVRLTDSYFPLVPVSGARLRAIAAGAVIQTTASLLGFWVLRWI